MQLFDSFFNHKTAIVGAGKFCERFLKYFFGSEGREKKPEIVGVADKCSQAPGIVLAGRLGLPTTTDYREFACLAGLGVILEMSNDPTLSDAIAAHMPDHVRIVDHYEVRTLFELLIVREYRDHGLEKIRSRDLNLAEIERMHEQMMAQFARILEKKNRRSRRIVRSLWEQQETVSQIIRGNTIPTFVIDRYHQITHWNKALEQLTGVPAADMIGTNRQWFPFYTQPRPTMADLIVGQTDESEIGRFYDNNWSPSALIEGAFQAEGFFKNMGESGKWLFFTAAPIRSRNGEMIGAIETFWDITADKRLVQEQARYNRELSTLVDLYAALSEPVHFEQRIQEAFRVVNRFLDADCACIFLLDETESYCMRFQSGYADEGFVDDAVHIAHMAVADKITVLQRSFIQPAAGSGEASDLTRSMIYVPIRDKENNPFGMIRITSRKPPADVILEKNILELIGNRIGVAVENALLQEKVVRSEEKYRTLFNNDPTPIFILDPETGWIIDMNQRAEATYGYRLEELRETPFTALGDADDEEIISGLAGVSREQSLLISKKRHYRKNGRPLYVTIVISVAEYGGRDILIVNTTDITESVEKEAQLIQAGKMTTLGVMAAGMAHEINQPLNAIQIRADYFLKMLKKGEPIPPADFEVMTINIIENVDRAAQVIRRVRDFARRTEVMRNEIYINAPIKDSLKVVEHALKSHQIRLVMRLAEPLPPILADHNRLEQVFINLMTNAIDAIEEKAAKRPDQPHDKVIKINSFMEKGSVTVTVSDTGAGMSEYVRERIFEPFFTTKETGKGTGLGVSISYGIIKDYDGKIEVDSKVDEGTTFKVSFPPAPTVGKDHQ